MLSFRTKKMSKKEVEKMASTSTSLMNIMNIMMEKHYPKSSLFLRKLMDTRWYIKSPDLISKIGNPVNARMTGYESTPGVWIVEHDIGITWMIWSDGHHKNCWKGTSYELIIPDNITDAELHTCLIEFFTYTGSIK